MPSALSADLRGLHPEKRFSLKYGFELDLDLTRFVVHDLCKVSGFGLPPEKRSSLRCGFEPWGGCYHGTEEACG